MPNVTFLPTNDAQLLQWSQNFSTRLTAAPTTYGLTAAQCTAYTGYQTAFATTLQACQPDVRSKSNVTAKNAARDVLKLNAKLLASIVNGQATVTDAMKQQLGLNVRARPQPIPAPSSAPIVEVIGVSGWKVAIGLRASNVDAKRRKPAGVSGATVMSFVGPTPSADLSAWKYEGMSGKTVVDVTFPNTVAPGSRVWITAFWFNGRKQTGPAASPIGTNLQGGTVSMAA